MLSIQLLGSPTISADAEPISVPRRKSRALLYYLADRGGPVTREQILALIGRGMLKPGTQVPTMRQVAVALKIDLNTVQRAYAELEREGVLSKQRGVGTFVTDVSPPPRNTKRLAQDFAARRVSLL